MIKTPHDYIVIEAEMEDQEPKIRRVTGDDFDSVVTKLFFIFYLQIYLQ
jgi:hypothetical protein